MLDSHVDGFNVEAQAEAPAVEDVPLQIQNLDVEASSAETSPEVDCSLPDLPLKTLMTHIDIIGRLREQGEIRNLLGFQPSPSLEPIPVIPKDEMCPVPYFIPELEMSCASIEAGQMNELTLVSLEDPNLSELPDIIQANPSRIEEINVPGTEEEHILEMEEPQVAEMKEATLNELEDINATNFEELPEPSGVEIVSEDIPVNEEPSSPIIIAQKPTQIEDSIPTVMEEPVPEPMPSFISSMIGLKPFWRPSVRLCFGDREQKRTKTLTEEEIKQQTSIALKSLILSIGLFRKFEAAFQEKFNENNFNQLDGSKSSPTFLKMFRQNVFQPVLVPENRQKQRQKERQEEHQEERPEERQEERLEALPENALAGGEPVEQRPIIQDDELRRRLYRLDASDGWDSDPSECSDSDDSGVNNTMCMNRLSRHIMKMKRPIADRKDIEESGRILFSQPVKLYRFTSARSWQREGLETPYTGDIKILELEGKYYILLREKNTGFLLVYTRIHGSWDIGYMANRTDSCSWFNFNYAYCPEGTPEHFACTFREPSHASEFVTRVRNLVLKCRFVSSP